MALGGSPDRVWLIWLFAFSLLSRPWVQQWLFQGLEKMIWVSGGQVIRMSVFAVGVVLFVRSPDDISIEILQKGDALANAEPWASMPNSGEW